MAKDWTCARCSARNVETAVSCQTCGLIRGSVVPMANAMTPPPDAMTAPPPPVWSADASASVLPPEWAVPPGVAPAGQPPVPVRTVRRLPLGLLIWIGIAAVGGIVGFMNTAGRSDSGEINKPGELAASDLRVGDCFDLPKDAVASGALVDKSVAKPCSQPHQYEVFFAGTISSPAYPTDDEFKTWVVDNCGPAFEAYVGVSPEVSKLDAMWFYPVESAWSKGDRRVQCSLEDPSNPALTSSLKGAAR